MNDNDEISLLKNIGDFAEKTLKDISSLHGIIQKVIEFFDGEIEERKRILELSVVEAIRSISMNLEKIMMVAANLKTNEQRENAVDKLHSMGDRLGQLNILLAQLKLAEDAPCTVNLEYLRTLIEEGRKTLLEKMAINVEQEDIKERIKNVVGDIKGIEKLNEELNKMIAKLEAEVAAARTELDGMKKKQTYLKVFIGVSTIFYMGRTLYDVVGGIEGMSNIYSWMSGSAAETVATTAETAAGSEEAARFFMEGSRVFEPVVQHALSRGVSVSSITEAITGVLPSMAPQMLLSFGQFAAQSASLMMLMRTYQEQGEDMLDTYENTEKLYQVIQDLYQHILGKNKELLNMLKQKKELLEQLSQLKTQSIKHVANNLSLVNNIQKLIESLTVLVDTSAVDASRLSGPALELLQFIQTHNKDVAEKAKTQKEMANILGREPEKIETITFATNHFIASSNKQPKKETKKPKSNIHTLADIKGENPAEENINASTAKINVSANHTATVTVVSTQQYTEKNYGAKKEAEKKLTLFFAEGQKAMKLGGSEGKQAFEKLTNPEELQKVYCPVNSILKEAAMERAQRRNENGASSSGSDKAAAMRAKR